MNQLGIFVAVLSILTNIYYIRQKKGGQVIRKLTSFSLFLCAGWDAFCTNSYIQVKSKIVLLNSAL